MRGSSTPTPSLPGTLGGSSLSNISLGSSQQAHQSNASLFAHFNRGPSSNFLTSQSSSSPTPFSASNLSRGGLLSLRSGSRYLSALGPISSSFFGVPPPLSQPPPFDIISDFPSLSSRNESGHSVGSNIPGRTPYVGMVKQPGPATAEFQMSSEDFPALPGTTGAAPTPVSTHDVKTSEQSNAGLLSNSALPITSNSSTSNADALKALVSSSSRGVRMSPDGRISNIPPGIMTDQFGMLGLLTFLRNKDSNPNLSSLALGQDLTQLGLNLNSPEVLHPTFAGPWQDSPCRPQDVSYPVPSEYIVSPSIRDSLAPLNLCRYGDDLLFYIFYMYVQDLLQIAAAAELYDREWRYHKGEGVWITRAPGIPPVQKTTTFERGTYFVFDVGQWKKVAKELVLEYDKLEARPSLPSANSAIIPPPLPSNH